MEPNKPKQPLTSWFLLGAIVLVVGGLLTVWVVRFDDIVAADRANGDSGTLPLGDLKGGVGYLGQVWENKISGFEKLFTSQLEASTTPAGDDQNQGQVGQLTNAGLTNQQIETIEQDLFENVAPQE